MNYSNGNSFGASVGNALDYGGGNSYGFPGDGTLPASASWMFAVIVWRI